jgi:hypothetical protein
MSENVNRRIEIDPCPRCGKPHHYALKVTRSRISDFLPGIGGDTPDERSFVRLFTCPVESSSFQATVSLIVERGFRIKDVEVLGDHV